MTTEQTNLNNIFTMFFLYKFSFFFFCHNKYIQTESCYKRMLTIVKHTSLLEEETFSIVVDLFIMTYFVSKNVVFVFECPVMASCFTLF